MCAPDSQIEGMLHQLKAQRLDRDPLGKVKLALSNVDPKDRKKLVTEFLIHACDKWHDSAIASAADSAKHILAYLEGNEPLDACLEVLREFRKSETTKVSIPDQSTVTISTSAAANICGTLFDYCCQRELEAAGLINRVAYQPDAMTVVAEIYYSLENKAQQIDETEWQFQQVIKHLSRPRKSDSQLPR